MTLKLTLKAVYLFFNNISKPKSTSRECAYCGNIEKDKNAARIVLSRYSRELEQATKVINQARAEP